MSCSQNAQSNGLNPIAQEFQHEIFDYASLWLFAAEVLIPSAATPTAFKRTYRKPLTGSMSRRAGLKHRRPGLREWS
ncbi:hypothetical protein [Tardiphaga sp. 813_E8_N1_3]|uniref:hypothetical protein n=1 Tax=Tardiphaga sp. 813_E8_N1_3 TaxID=3240760 RepID=UPI003F208A8B